MQNVMRQYKRHLLFFILLFIGLPMLFFGIPMLGTGGNMMAEDRVLATVGDVELKESVFLQNLSRQAEMSRTSLAELSIEQREEVFKSMTDSALIELDEKQRGFVVDRSLLEAEMRKWEQFQTDGRFDAAKWNEWVEAMQRRGLNWNEIYEDLQRGKTREVYMDYVLASAQRITDAEIEKELADSDTKLKLKAAKIEPVVEPTEEQMRAHYDENQERYRAPDTRTAEFAAISLAPGVPDKALEMVQRARAGEDFAALADENAGETGIKNGGDIGWQTPGPNDAEYRRKMFDLAVGEVSDPVAAPYAYFVYKIDEERTNPETGAREVKARQMVFPAQLTEEDRAARRQQADELAARAQEVGLTAAAQEMGAVVLTTNPFHAGSTEIENVPQTDVAQFAAGFENQTDEAAHTVIEAGSSLYVARQIDRQEGEISPYEEVQERVKTDTIAKLKTEAEYTSKVEAIAEKIETQATSLDDIATLAPEANATIEDVTEFKVRDFFAPVIYVNAQEIMDAFRDKEPGAIAGPFKGLLGGVTYFLQLESKTPPTEEDKAKWAEEKTTKREQREMTARNELVQDYVQHLREKRLDSGEVALDINDELFAMHVLNQQAAQQPEQAPLAADDGAITTPVSATKAIADEAPAADAAAPGALAPATEIAGQDGPAPASDTPATLGAAPADAAATEEAPAEAPAEAAQ